VNVHHLLSQYGYFAVFAMVAAESLGIPLPGETILIAAALYAGSTHNLSVWGIFAVASTAAIIGDNIGFWIGDKGGYRLLHRYGHRVRADASKIKVGRLIFDRHGGKVVFFGRFVSVLRTYAAFLAGTLKMRWRRFLPYNAAGGIVWAAIYTFVPYIVGSAINKLSGPVDVGFGVAAAVAVIAGIWVIRSQANRLAVEAEEAYQPRRPTPGRCPRVSAPAGWGSRDVEFGPHPAGVVTRQVAHEFVAPGGQGEGCPSG
jgi:membrane protein DedA with SNARE-associated domain